MFAAESHTFLAGCRGMRGITLALTFTVAIPLAHAGTLTTLYQFTGGSDGSDPNSKLIEDVSGTLYGSAALGGTKNCTTKVGTANCLRMRHPVQF